MLRVGIIGVGFMGYTHFEAMRSVIGARVAGIATRNQKKLAGDWTGIQGNFGPPAGQVDLEGIRAVSDYRELLDDPEIDLIDVCLPTDGHHDVVIECLRAGKDVLCEKPLAVSLDEAQAMVACAKEVGQRLFVAHVLPFFPEFRYAAEAIRGERFGKLRAAHFRRMICPPDWSAGMADFRKLGGWGIDLHIHDNHFIAHACGAPDAVFSAGLLQDEFVNHVQTSYLYGVGGPAVSCMSGGIAASALQFGHGYELHFEDATLLFDAGTLAGEWVVSRPLIVLRNDGTAETPELSADGTWCEAFTQELQLVTDSLASGADAGPLSAEVALDALRMCYAEAESIRTGKAVTLSGCS